MIFGEDGELGPFAGGRYYEFGGFRKIEVWLEGLRGVRVVCGWWSGGEGGGPQGRAV